METVDIGDWTVTREKVDEAVRRIVLHARPLQIIAFGSRARGDHHAESDLDLAIIVDTFVQSEKRQLPELLFGLRLETDLLVVDKAKYDRHRPWLNSVYNYIDREGVVLYDREHPECASPDALYVGGRRRVRTDLRAA